MSNNSSKVSSPSKKTLEPNQHVNFTLGMVLGEDDFNQEFTYLSGRDLWLARDLLGYGTVCGLEVSVDTDKDKGPYIQVAPGVALSPRGQLIRADPAQCAYLDTWIADEATQTKMGKHGVTDTATLYLTLCYRDCYTEDRPVPGEPCRTEAEGELVKPARIQDDFSLELRWDPPFQQEEDALRDFVAWLRQVKVTETADEGDANLQKFAKALRKAAKSPGSSSTDYLYGDPPASLKIPGDRACEYLQLAFRIWATELRPMWRGQAASCVTPTNNDCVLLATLHIPASKNDAGEWVVDKSKWDDPLKLVDETSRPYLVHLRMLQEWMTCGRDALLTPSDHVAPETAFDQASNPGSSELYSRADHTHGTPPRPFLEDDITSTPDTATISGLHTRVAKLQGTPLVSTSLEPGYVLTLKKVSNETLTKKKVTKKKALAEAVGELEWSPEPIPDLDGEVTGPLTRNRVAAIQSLPVSASAPAAPGAGQVLMLKTVLVRQPPVEVRDTSLGKGRPLTDFAFGKALPTGARTALSDAAIAEPLPGEFQPPRELDPGLLLERIEWQAADLPPVVQSLPMVGDVGGSTNDNHIDRLQGKLVEAAEPTPGQVLTFSRSRRRDDEGRWIAADPSEASLPDLAGDVVDSPTKNTIKFLQGKLVDAPQPAVGQVLTFVEGDKKKEIPDRWVAADPQTSIGDFVTHPQAAGAFGIVAAGVCKFNSYDPAHPQLEMLSTYNGLSAVGASSFGQNIELQFYFPNDQFDASRPNYIVKLTPWMWQDDKYPFIAYMRNLADKYVVVGVTFFDKATTYSGHLMIEISQFEPDAG